MSTLHMQVSVGSSWADFADALALSKLGSVRIEGCSLASATEGASQQPDALVKHIDTLLDNVFQVLTFFTSRLSVAEWVLESPWLMHLSTRCQSSPVVTHGVTQMVGHNLLV